MENESPLAVSDVNVGQEENGVLGASTVQPIKIEIAEDSIYKDMFEIVVDPKSGVARPIPTVVFAADGPLSNKDLKIPLVVTDFQGNITNYDFPFRIGDGISSIADYRLLYVLLLLILVLLIILLLLILFVRRRQHRQKKERAEKLMCNSSSSSLVDVELGETKRNPGDIFEKEDDANEHMKSQLSENDRLRLTQYLPGEDADNELSEQVINKADIGKAVLDGKLEKDVQSGVETGVKKPTVPTPSFSQGADVITGWTNSLSDPASVYTKGPGWFKNVHSHSSWKRRG